MNNLQQEKNSIFSQNTSDYTKRSDFPFVLTGKSVKSHILHIKKLPKEQRRINNEYKREPHWLKRCVLRMKEDSQYLRSIVQGSFMLLCVWIGIEFHLFMKWAQSSGTEVFHPRPPGVEGFLPISALMSLKYLIQTGIINNVHPSGLFILLAVMLLALFMKKAFCGWLCPIGTVSESLWMAGQRIFGKNVSLPKWIDYPMRSLKYALLVFFIYAILQMDGPTLEEFIHSPYNKVADVKMYLFFMQISSFALWTLIILAVLSFVIKNFWCRYLCPYGALLGALSWLSPLKVTRNPSSCIDCKLCTKACPSSIKVHTAKRVWSDECMSCYACVESCPVKDTLVMRASRRSKEIPSWIFAFLLVGVFIAVTGLAMVSGRWQNGMTKEEYRRRVQNIESPLYQHHRGSVPTYGPND
jgi:polyferredoxin